jgi:hypothetical protein
MRKGPTKLERDLMQRYRLAPHLLSQAEVMRKLKLGKDYHKFYRLFHRCTIADSKEDYQN